MSEPSLPNPPQSLTITADDFGFGVPTSRGIITAHKAGVVTSTSLMAVTGDHAAASVALLADAPDLEIGMHLVLTGDSQKPIVAKRNSGLVGRNGMFHSLLKLLWLAWYRRLDPNGVQDEICAQAEKCQALLGRAPAYVDGHHHAHQLPIVREALVAAIATGVLPAVARCTVEAESVRKNVRGSRIRRSIMHRLGLGAKPVFVDGQVRTNDSCFGMIGARDLTQLNPWEHYFAHLPAEGAIECFVHPGEVDETLTGRDTYVRERAVELEALLRLAEHPDWPRWAARLRTKSAAQALVCSTE